MKYFGVLAAVLIIIVACSEEEPIVNRIRSLELMQIPNGFPEMDFPEGNGFTKERWDLGKKLFFEPALSLDNSISCSSCHKQDLAFSDDVAVSEGVHGATGTRNSPSLANAGYQPYFMREGGLPTLEMQVLVPIQEHAEFDFNIVLVAERLKADSVYAHMAEQCYSREMDAFIITRALATFERSLISGYSRYDQFVNYSDEDALSETEKNGMSLFFSERTNCSECHSGFNFTNYSFENNGLYTEYSDEGRKRLTGLEEDLALFKVPSLRNVDLTGPYMHDGSLESLDEVLKHYNRGGKNHPQKSDLIKNMELSDKELIELGSFLRALTDEGFVSNPIFKNE